MLPLYLLNQTCQIKNYLGESPTGENYSEATTISCRIEETFKVRRGQDGSFIRYKESLCFLPPEFESITVGSQIITGGRTYTVGEVSVKRGVTLSHIECLLD